MGDTYPRFTVAAVQAASVFFDRESTIDKAVRFIEEAGDKGAAIIGFPETFIPGHPAIWYAAKKSNPLPLQSHMFKEYVSNSVRVPSPATDRLCAAARKAHACVVVGISEQDNLFGGTLYLSQLFISDSGEIMGVHRKLVSTGVEKFIFTCGDGSHLNVYDTPHGKLSGMSCGEHTHSLFKYALLAMGTQIHIGSWPAFPDRLHRQTQRNSVDFRTRQFAHEGKIFVIMSNGVCDTQNIDYCCNTQEEKDNLVAGSGGGSGIIGPAGEYIAGPQPEGEGVITAEICLEDSIPGKQAHNVLGHYARWDVLSLNFNREKASPFRSVTDGHGSRDYSAELEALRREIGEVREKLGHIEDRPESPQ